MQAQQVDLSEVIKAGLLSDIKATVIDKIVSEQVEAFERIVRVAVEKHVNAVTFGSIEHLRDLATQMDRFQVDFRWDGKLTETKTHGA